MWRVPEGVMPVRVRMSAPPWDEGDLLADPRDRGGGEDATEGDGGHDEGPPAEDGARVQDGVAPDLGLVAEHRPELLQAGADGAPGQLDEDLALVQAKVGADGARPQVRAAPEDRVSHVVEVRGLHPVHEEAV